MQLDLKLQATFCATVALSVCVSDVAWGQAFVTDRASRRAITLTLNPCSSLPQVVDGDWTPFLELAPGHLVKFPYGELPFFCVFEAAPWVPPGELERQLQNYAGEFMTLPEVQPLEAVPQTVSVATSNAIANARDKSFRYKAGSWEGSAGQSPAPDTIQVAVLDSVAHADAAAVCPNGNALCPDWPRRLAESMNTVPHGVAMAGIIQQMGCPANASVNDCALQLRPVQALDSDVDPVTQMWQTGSTRGDIVSLCRAMMTIVHELQYAPRPTVISVSLAFNSTNLSPLGSMLLNEALGAAASMGAVVVMSAGNEHTTANTASYGLMAPAAYAVTTRGSGAQLAVAAVGHDDALLGMSKVSASSWFADSKDAAPFSHVGQPRLFTGTSVAAAGTAGVIAAAWNTVAYMSGGEVINWIEANATATRFVQDDPRIGGTPPPVVDGYDYMTSLLPPGSGYSVARVAKPKPSPYDIEILAADALNRLLPNVQSAYLPGSAPPHHPSLRAPPLPSLSTDSLLVPQPDPFSCGICIVSNNMVLVEQTSVPGQAALEPVEVTLNNSSGSTTYSLPTSGTTTFELSPAPSLPSSARVTFRNTNTNATVSAELDIVQ